MDKQQALDRMNAYVPGTLMETLGIQFTDFGRGFLEATMPVDARHLQPMKILHGGATAALAETVGSMAAAIELEGTDRHAVGLELAINHIRSQRDGIVVARAERVHAGRSTQLWQIHILGDQGKLVAVAKLTMMVMSKPPQQDA
ncbi:MAG: PaaI family thioesterase [Wenzhouxiangellaceae bacterium]|nr:PaaI family thioesterase [Wenzhouxiangellaceae bacterium]